MKRRSLITGAVVATAAVLMTATCFRSFDYQHSGNRRPFDVVNIRIGNNEFAVPAVLNPKIGGYDRDRVLFQKGNVPRVEGRLPFCPRPPMTRIDANYLRVDYPVLKSRKPSYLQITNRAFYNLESFQPNHHTGDRISVRRYCDNKTPRIISGSLVDFCKIEYLSYRGLDIVLFTNHAGINSFSNDDHVKSVYSFLDNMQTSMI